MGSLKWKVGDHAYMKADISGPLAVPVLVKIIKVGCEGIHNIKVHEAANPNQIYYCNSRGLSKRKAQAERNRKSIAIPQDIKEEAEERTEKRMSEIKEKIDKQNLPSFQEFMVKARACVLTIDRYNTEETLVMARLAEKQLYEEIKNGCVWENDEYETAEE